MSISRRGGFAIAAVLTLLLVGAPVWLIQPIEPAPAEECVSPGANAGRLRADVAEIVTQHFPRHYENPEALDRIARRVSSVFLAAKAQVTERPWEVDGRRFRYVVGHFGPETQERVVVGAHSDTHGALPGADDNASGVAGVLELARLLSNAKLHTRVELAVWPLEEAPYGGSAQMGSVQHAQTLREKGAKVLGMLSLEMIGFFSDEPDSQKLPFFALKPLYPSQGNFIAVVGNAMGVGIVRKVKRAMAGASFLPVHSINAPEAVPGVDRSDHASFWRRGFPAAMVTDTAFYRNEHYHTALDTPEKLDYDRMAQVVDGVYCATLALARR